MKGSLTRYHVLTLLFCLLFSGAGSALLFAREAPESPDQLAKKILHAHFEKTRNAAVEQLKAYPVIEVLPQWLAVLEGTKHAELQKEIIELVAPANDRRVVDPLAMQLRSPYAIVRKAAAIALKECGDDRMYPRILEMATSDNPIHRVYMVEAMFYVYDRRFYPTLVELLRDANKSIRIYVVRCMAMNRLSQALPLVRNVVIADDNDEVRINAINAIGDMGDFGGFYVLARVLPAPNRDVRLATVRALRKISSNNNVYPLSNQLARENDDIIKDEIITALVGLRRVGVMTGLENILLRDMSVQLRIRVAYALGVIGDQRALPLLLKGLQDADYRVRAEVCNSLGFYRNPASIGALLGAVSNDRELYVRSAGLYALKRINQGSAVLPLFDLYAKEKDPVFRELLRKVLRHFIDVFI